VGKKVKKKKGGRERESVNLYILFIERRKKGEDRPWYRSAVR